MNDKDKEAFRSWWDGYILPANTFTHTAKDTWQAACEYKNKEYSDIADARMQTSFNNVKLQAENAELQGQLKSCIFVYEEKVNRLVAENAKLEAWKNKAKEKMPSMQMRIHELEGKLEIAVEALEKFKEIRRLDGNGNEYEGREFFMANEALKAINED